MQYNEFDLSTLLSLLKKKLKRILCITFLAGILGFLIAWCIPKEYESSAAIIPEANESGALGSVSALTSMAGIDLGEGTDAIGPDLYPNVVTSNRFIVDLLYTPVRTVDGKVNADLMTYLKGHTERPWWGYGKLYLGKLMKQLNPPKEFNKRDTNERINPERLSIDDDALVEGVRGAIGCQMDEKSGMINISFRSQDPLVSKTIVDTLMAQLQTFITAYRTSKARTDLRHYQELEKEALKKYEKTQRAYARYCDSHMGNLLEAYQTEQEALETEMSVALNAYTQVKQQVQLADAKVQEKTPAFTIVETASVPARHCAPRKLLMAIAFMFLAFVGSVGWYYVRLLFSRKGKEGNPAEAEKLESAVPAAESADTVITIVPLNEENSIEND